MLRSPCDQVLALVAGWLKSRQLIVSRSKWVRMSIGNRSYKRKMRLEVEEVTVELIAFIDEIVTTWIEFTTGAEIQGRPDRITDRHAKLL